MVARSFPSGFAHGTCLNNEVGVRWLLLSEESMRIILFVLFSASVLAAEPSRLQQNMERITRSVNAKWGIYVKVLETGEEIAINADRQMDTMSTIKIPLMVEAFHQVEAGKFSLTDAVTLTEEMKRPGTGVLRSLDAGARITIKDTLTLMNIISDNSATDILFEKVGGPEAVNSRLEKEGYRHMRATTPASGWFAALRGAQSAADFHRQGKSAYGLSSAREMGQMLERIAKGEAVSKAASGQMMTMLRGQIYSSRLPKYVTGFRVAHKTGDFLPYIGNDVGVFESPKRNIVVCVFTANHYGVAAQLEDAIARIGELIANHYAVE